MLIMHVTAAHERPCVHKYAHSVDGKKWASFAIASFMLYSLYIPNSKINTSCAAVSAIFDISTSVGNEHGWKCHEMNVISFLGLKKRVYKNKHVETKHKQV